MRAAPGGTISEQNCHPFVHGGWMFQHNGEVPAFSALKRELTLEVDPALYPSILGNADSEVCFYLALTYGLAEYPVVCVRRRPLGGAALGEPRCVARFRRERALAVPLGGTNDAAHD